MCKSNLQKHRHTYSCVPTRTNVYGRVRTMFWTIFDRTDMKISLYRIVFRVEFDGNVRFCIAPPKSFFQRFLQFFRFPSFRKNLDLFFPCHRRAQIFAATAAAAAAAIL